MARRATTAVSTATTPASTQEVAVILEAVDSQVAVAVLVDIDSHINHK